MTLQNDPIYSIERIRKCEHLACEQFHISSHDLMERAGSAVYDFLLHRFPRVKKIAVCCGGGNNGGDGYVLARLLHEHGLNVTVWQVGSHNHLPIEAKYALDKCKKIGVSIHLFTPTTDLQPSDLIVDALCGIGITQPLRVDMIAMIEKMHVTALPIVAIDIPSGICADTGQVLGIAVQAIATVTFIGLKMGLLTGAGVAYAGEIVCDDLQLPQDLFSQVQPIAEKIQIKSYQHYLKPRPRDWHKGLSGHVLVVGGDVGFSGAARMAAEAALRVGCGLVTVATRLELATVLNVSCPEIMCQGIDDPTQLEPLLMRADVVILGPGLGQSNWAKSLWESVCRSQLPLVVDADGLNILAPLHQSRENWILTPHPGEAARLLNQETRDIQQNRLLAVQTIQKRFGGVCVLKGAGSLIATPDLLPAVCDKGNPGMATAGMGDILSCVIGGLLAQNIPLGDAAKLGVYLHAMAGDLAAKQGERGMLATHLLPYLRRLVNEID